jgi:hypothetical protein
MQELIILTPHLVEKIRTILAADLDLPEDLRAQLHLGVENASAIAQEPEPKPKAEQNQERDPEAENRPEGNDDEDEASDFEETTKAKKVPVTIDIFHLEHLSRWATSDTTASSLKKKDIDPLEYGMIPLLSGTELYIPSSQLPHLPDINPYLPSYLSPLPPSFGTEYRSLTRQLSTVLNILFSIFGSAFAVYVAATTGGGYTREKGILLGVLAGVVVGIADGALVWIFAQRVKEGREEGRKMAIKLGKGSGGDGLVESDRIQDESEVTAVMEKEIEKEAEPVKKEFRLRRRAIGPKAE